MARAGTIDRHGRAHASRFAVQGDPLVDILLKERSGS
jgi:hypothetical protein